MASEDYEYDYSDEDDYPIEDDMSWDATGDNPNAAPVVFSPKGKSAIRLMKGDELIPEMNKRLKDVTEVLDIPASAAAVLLREHNWNKEVVMEVFYNDPDALLQKCGVYYRVHPNNKRKASTSSTCEICYDEDVDMLCMPCGHEFCKVCWKEFIGNAVAEGPSCVRQTCPQAKCTELMTEEEVEKAAPEVLPKFQNYQLRSFVDSNDLTRWCPGNGCENVAVAMNGSAKEQEGNHIVCDACAAEFCLTCGEEPHLPCSCKNITLWSEKCRNESETANWILANTKSCPKCNSRIEKNQGCNHMTCQCCRFEFCWICMQDWHDHGANTGGYYKCNKFDPNNPDEKSDAAKAKRELDRYLHYYKRYHAHSEAQNFAKRQLKETEQRMVLLQESSENSKWADVEFLKTANEQLVECRRVLKYTYVFAYYMTDESKALEKERFEHHQEMLERFTEHLSEKSELPLAEMDRTDVVNQTRVVDRFMKNMLKYVEDGMEDMGA